MSSDNKHSMAEPLIKLEHQPFALRRFVAAVLVNVLINTVIAAIITLLGVGRGFAVTFVFSQCIGFSIFFANLAVLPLYRRASRTGAQIAIIVSAVITGALAGTALGALANGIPLPAFLRGHSGYFGQVIVFALLFGFLISYIFISLSLLSEEKVRRLELEKNAVESELRLLQSQMEPHFLFNTLANIRSLIDADPGKAGAMLDSFAAFIRSSLRTSRDRTVTLQQEMDIVGSYLDLFSVRMGDRLRYRLDVPDSLRDLLLPPLLVQPLVENAVKHGLEPSVRGGEIAVSAGREGDVVRIVVADSGVGINEASTGNGIGLDNIRKRLQLAFGEKGRLTLEANQPSGVKAVIELPVERPYT